MRKLAILSLVVGAVALVGCGSTDKTYNTYEANITDEPYEIPGGDAIIIDSSDNATITRTDTTIGIDCGEGGCGDIRIGAEVTN